MVSYAAPEPGFVMILAPIMIMAIRNAKRLITLKRLLISGRSGRFSEPGVLSLPVVLSGILTSAKN
jgi:hypothetical protein